MRKSVSKKCKVPAKKKHSVEEKWFGGRREIQELTGQSYAHHRRDLKMKL